MTRPARKTRSGSAPPRIGLALAGGGPLGAIYEIGALCALEETLTGIDFSDCHSHVGVSAGGFIAAGPANGIWPRELCASFIENVGAKDNIFQPSVLMRPAWGEFAQRLARVPGLAARGACATPFRAAVWPAPSKEWGRRCLRVCSRTTALTPACAVSSPRRAAATISGN